MKVHANNDDVEAPSYGGRRPAPKIKLVPDEFADDDEESPSQRRKRQAKSRLSALVMGLVTLLAAAFGAYYFLTKNGIDLQMGASQHANFQGTVAMDTIQMHAVPQDCWVAIHGSVYDLTQYAPLHPGPSTLITDHCGTDATAVYTAVHSRALLPTVNEYLLGTLQGEGGTSGGSTASPPSAGGNNQSGTSSGPQIALATMEMHSVPNDCWVAYYGNVYDMTQYAPTHPGPSTLITRHCGSDATAAYASAHRQSLLATVSRHLLGALEGAHPAAFPTGNGGQMESSDD